MGKNSYRWLQRKTTDWAGGGGGGLEFVGSVRLTARRTVLGGGALGLGCW